MKIGIIGYGNMGSAIARQLKNNYEVLVFDKDKARLGSADGIAATASIAELVEKSGIVILAVKPQDFSDALAAIKAVAKNKLFISIAAGISATYIEDALGQARVIRTMPNMPAKIGESMTCLAQGRFATLDDLDTAENLFEYMGEVLVIEENMMNQATAISGSGPAYVCNFLESQGLGPENVPDDKKAYFLDIFQKAARELGFSEHDARLLTKATFNGTLSFLKREKISPAELREQVTSKGGTTEAALVTLNKGGSLVDAVKAAAKRAEELSRG
ncbi:MAG: pyrroline-5-carboxylate reductase [Candidatus Omnitrophota bacterium]